MRPELSEQLEKCASPFGEVDSFVSLPGEAAGEKWRTKNQSRELPDWFRFSALDFSPASERDPPFAEYGLRR